MSDTISVSQNSAKGAETTQIACQNNYYGMTPESASDLAIKLFMDNFPRLREEARIVAEKRADELIKNVVEEMKKNGQQDYSSFSDPDMQYVLYEAQKGYARFGTEELLSTLSSLISNRVKYDKEMHVKIILDKAIEVVPQLQPSHIDYLSLIYFCKRMRFKSTPSIDELSAFYNDAIGKLKLPQERNGYDVYLDMLGFFTIGLNTAYKFLANAYGFSEETLKSVLPRELEYVPHDYQLTPIGVVLAILNINKKLSWNLDIHSFIQ